jgi:ribosome maturation factor RimP
MSQLKGKELREKLVAIVEALLKREGYELVELEVLGAGPGTIVRLFVDKAGGVTLDECASVSEAVSAMFDVEDPITSAYTLEVSSPGLDRPLRKRADYERFAGRQAKLKTYGPVEGAGNRKVFVGKLVGHDEASVRIDVDGTVFTVPFEAIAKAHLVWSPDDEPKQ